MRSVLRGALLACALPFAFPAAADVFINEIHYDDADTPTMGDTNEAIEIVATGGEDLSQYSIVLYNGSSPAAATVYDTDAVPVGSAVSCSGGGGATIAVINYPQNGVQNGGNDAIALVQGSTVIQFLSYEGVATASGGPASGMASIDIGVSEAGSTVEGTSLQLGGGPSSTYSGFSWNGSATATMGACNNGQTFGAPVDNPPQLTGSNPANGANTVAVASDVVLTFSEAVVTTDPWFALDCGAGTIAGAITGSGNTRTFNPTADLPFNATCTATLTPANVVDTDATADALAGTTSFTFSTVADLAPGVTSVSPTENATGVNVNANLAVTFSEAVTPTLSNWLTLTCVSSGPHTVVISGGPTAWTINPDADFAFSENCTASIAASNVVDQDGLPDPMSAPKNWTFTTGADLAPTVSSTTPADNAINVSLGSDVTVVFSEAVMASNASFTVNCATSGAHTFALNAAPTSSYTLNPTADFAGTEVCTVTVVAAQVTDIDGAPTMMGVNYVFDFTTGNDPGNYYATVDATSCTTLRSSLHALIRNHTAVSYSGSPPNALTVMNLGDEDPLNSANILDVYKNHSCPKQLSGATCYNKEHTWPNSLGFNDMDDWPNGSGVPYPPYTDTHMLYASDVGFNSHRGNLSYGNCTGTCSRDDTEAYFGFGGGDDDNLYNSSVYEVWDHRKGDAARAALYMDVRYEGGTNSNGQPEPDLRLTDNLSLVNTTPINSPQAIAYMGVRADLIEWANGDLPDTYEQMRNDVVYSFQGNRNPFIDHPEWVNCVFSCNCAAPSNPPTATADGVTVNEDSGATVIDVLANDPDPDGGPKFVQSTTQPAGGTVTIGVNGTNVSFAPNANVCGPTSFSYSLNGGSSATVSVSVTCQNDAPNAVGTLADLSYPVGTVVSLATASGFADVDNDTLTYSATGLPASLSIDLNSGVISGTLQGAEIGVHNIVVTARDPSNATATQSFSITVTALDNLLFVDGFEG
ncbi:MAG: Ig-like domain-containing protein [Xanthomonadales bacterium]|nr:Ig-like domain-containing protein [Xanthomonadales bacterium]MBP6078892.1 Ig-like domain-containing protein [Xanthomonadales bacterium]MBP7622367.1 Ig-like domain-containing protein [Xanthomonadales bacterium]